MKGYPEHSYTFHNPRRTDPSGEALTCAATNRMGASGNQDG
jgi:hypothetical protein